MAAGYWLDRYESSIDVTPGSDWVYFPECGTVSLQLRHKRRRTLIKVSSFSTVVKSDETLSASCTQVLQCARKNSVATSSLQAVWDSYDQLDVQHCYLTAEQTRAEGWSLKIDWESSEGTSLAALWHFPINTQGKRKSQLRFDFSNVWQCRSLHTASAVIFYSSATLQIHNSYPRWCISVCWCGEGFGS